MRIRVVEIEGGIDMNCRGEVGVDGRRRIGGVVVER
jgi:hypothetical protein